MEEPRLGELGLGLPEVVPPKLLGIFPLLTQNFKRHSSLLGHYFGGLLNYSLAKLYYGWFRWWLPGRVRGFPITERTYL